MRSRLPFFIILLAGLSVALPFVAHAGIPNYVIIPASLATCPAGWGGLVVVANNIISFLVTIVLTFVAPIMFAYAGFLYLTSGGNPGQRTRANGLMLNLVVGVVIALAGYTMVDFLLTSLTTTGGVSAWTSQIFSAGSAQCLTVSTAFNQSGGATNTNPLNDDNCPGNLVCGTTGSCQADPNLDPTANGMAGDPCTPTSNSCSAGLVCDNTDACDTVATNPDPIPTSCNTVASTQPSTCTATGTTCQSGYCATTPPTACTGSGQSTCTAGTTCQNSVCVSADGNGNAIACTAGAGGTDITSKICAAAQAYYGTNTSAGPSGGVDACAWSVNNILTNAGVANLDTTSVVSLVAAITAGRGTQISQSQGVCGDIVAITGPKNHVGICMNNGCTGSQGVLSNSSSRAAFVWYSDITFAPSYNQGPGTVYQLTN
jgi:hypothetical protein